MKPTLHERIAQQASKQTGRNITPERVQEVQDGDHQESHPIDVIILRLLEKAFTKMDNRDFNRLR